MVRDVLTPTPAWCRRCGGAHPAVECYVIALQELSVPELRRFDQQMREEIALAAMADDLDVVRQMAEVLRGVRSRLERA